MPNLSLFLAVSSILLLLAVKPKLQHKVVDFFSNQQKSQKLELRALLIKTALLCISFGVLQQISSILR